TDFRVGNMGHSIRIGRQGGMMVAQFSEDGMVNTANTVPYDSAIHATWKIARSGDTTTWSTISEQGVETTLATSQFDWTNYMLPLLFAQRASDSTVEFTAIFRDFNGGSSAMLDPVCPADSLVDSFDTLDRVTWGRSGGAFYETGCRFESRDGNLIVALETGGVGPDSCSYGTSGIYDLLDHEITVEVEATLAATERVAVAVETIDQNAGTFVIQSGELRAVTRVGNNELQVRTLSYDPVAHRFLRFTAASNNGLEELEWQTSATGEPASFVFFARAGSLKNLDRVRFNLAANGYNDESPDTVIKFHGVN
ncbi:MAG: hypothetical protein H0V17_09795, partial [Deltaproteobacteria bacterium]|nr:hypothetical protein [Deltaproteobacteria bacterium]